MGRAMAKEAGITDSAGANVAKASKALTDKDDTVPGPSPDSSTNLIINDLLLRSAGRLLRLSVEKGLIGRRYGRQFAKDAIANRSLLQTAAAYGATKIATRSIPGAAVIWGGLLAKTLYDRRKGRRKASREGDRQLAEQAKPDNLI